MIISIVNLKGGVGKTTTTIYLATAYARMGNPTHVIDLDRQASAVDWAQSAAEDHDPLDFDVTLSVPKQPLLLFQLGFEVLISHEFGMLSTH